MNLTIGSKIWIITDNTGEFYHFPEVDEVLALPYDSEFRQGNHYVLRRRGLSSPEDMFITQKSAVLGMIIAVEKKMDFLSRQIEESHQKLERYGVLIDILEEEYFVAKSIQI